MILIVCTLQFYNKGGKGYHLSILTGVCRPQNIKTALFLFRLFVAHLEHYRSLLLRIDGDVRAGHPSVGAQVPQPDIGVPETQHLF